MLNAFTVDLEDWYHGLTSTNRRPEQWPDLERRIVPATNRLLALLAEYDVRATFFVLGCVAEQHPHLVADIAAAGHEIAAHGYDHRFVHQFTPAEFTRDLERTLAALEAVTGRRPAGYRAPYFSINQETVWAFDVLADLGFIYDSSVFPMRGYIYGFPGAPRHPYRLPSGLVEFPASTWSLTGLTIPVAGGFYARMLPGWLVRRGLRRLNEAGRPAILYVHPWELDREQPRVHQTPRERLTHYGGRHTLAGKLARLFTTFTFRPLSDLVDQCGFSDNGKCILSVGHARSVTSRDEEPLSGYEPDLQEAGVDV
jgi:polysaccharide deacetylase family protein (PEP-CTERM system associated)